MKRCLSRRAGAKERLQCTTQGVVDTEGEDKRERRASKHASRASQTTMAGSEYDA